MPGGGYDEPAWWSWGPLLPKDPSLQSLLLTLLSSTAASQNAYTSTDETVFQLIVPTDQPELLEECISVLAQFAFGIRWE